MVYFIFLWKLKGLIKREIDDGYEFILLMDGVKEKIIFRNMNFVDVDKRDIILEYYNWNLKVKWEIEKEEIEDLKDGM